MKKHLAWTGKGLFFLLLLAAVGMPPAEARTSEPPLPAQGGLTAWQTTLADMPYQTTSSASRFPFSFTYDGQSSDKILQSWPCSTTTTPLDRDRIRITRSWTDPQTKLRLVWDGVFYKDFPAADWVLNFENTGPQDTAILENIQTMDLSSTRTLTGLVPYRLQKLRGGIPGVSMYAPTLVNLDDGTSETIGSNSGRTSTQNFPFFRLETGQGTLLFGLEWSGTWKGVFSNTKGRLQARAGMELTHFRLHPGERVRLPRVLMLNWSGKVDEAHAQFRQLIYRHYAARRVGKAPQPIPFCNTCFTRGGGWLQQCNAQNQISLIKAYGGLGLEAMITDAGWNTGGWVNGVGTWDLRQDAYPDGMGPVAAAAKACGMVYGLWFEPERVIRGTKLYQAHPEWILTLPDAKNRTCLANFGLKEVQDYFFNLVKGYMALPGFRVYRQDFNMDPLPYWRAADAPDRQGITEIHYVEGLYAYWERIRAAWPDCLMEECAGGGHRVELGTVMRLDIHQKSDHWFDYEADQASLWSLSQYLPGSVMVAHLRDLDDYSFHSTLPSSLCLGWIADDPKFDRNRAKALLDRYRQVRHLLEGAWYPLTPYPWEYDGQKTSAAAMWDWSDQNFAWSIQSRRQHAHTSWLASQYHRPDLGEGMILAFRRSASPYPSIEVRLQGLKPQATYSLSSDRTGKSWKMKGSELMKRLVLELPEARQSDLITYHQER